MKRVVVERNIVAILFVLVLVVFSMAQRDTEKILHLYTYTTTKPAKLALLKNVSPVKHTTADKGDKRYN